MNIEDFCPYELVSYTRLLQGIHLLTVVRLCPNRLIVVIFQI